MRIVGGRHRGRNLSSPPGDATRPTSDRARQALFNILEHGAFAAEGSTLNEARVLDVFAGTGALGLEALSRGAVHAVFIETGRPALGVLRANIAALGEQNRAAVIAIDALHPPRAATPCTLAFLDPPYGRDLAVPTLIALVKQGWLAQDALVVVEVAAREGFTPPPDFDLVQERIYGAARMIFLRYAVE